MLHSGPYATLQYIISWRWHSWFYVHNEKRKIGKQPRISATALEKEIQESYGFISICLSQVPGLFLFLVALKTVITNKLGRREAIRASYFIVFPFPILKSCATIKEMEWLKGIRYLAQKVFPQKSIELLEDKVDENKKSEKEKQSRHQFYFH